MSTVVTPKITPVSRGDKIVNVSAVYVCDDVPQNVTTHTVSVEKVSIESPAAALNLLDSRYQALLAEDAEVAAWLAGKEADAKAFLEAKYVV